MPLDEEAVSLLHDIRQRNPHELVFCKEDGTPYHPGYISHLFGTLARRAGFDAHLHTTRHTYATTGLLAGVPIRTLQDLLGHEDLATTDIYTHVPTSLKKDAATAIGNAYKTTERHSSGNAETAADSASEDIGK